MRIVILGNQAGRRCIRWHAFLALALGLELFGILVIGAAQYVFGWERSLPAALFCAGVGPPIVVIGLING